MQKKLIVGIGTAAIAVASIGWMLKAVISREDVAPQVTKSNDDARATAQSAVPSVAVSPQANGPRPELVASLPPDSTEQAAYETALRIHRELTFEWTPEACLRIQNDMAQLLAQVPETSDLWRWSVDLGRACAGRIPLDRVAERVGFLERLLEGKPDNPALLMALAEAKEATGRYSEAIQHIEQALRIEQTAEMWDQMASTQLRHAWWLKTSHGDEDLRRNALGAAETASSLAIRFSDSRVDAWVLERMAHAKLGLGKNDEAIAWAEKSIAAIHVGGGEYIDRLSTSWLYFNVGEIFHKAGQRGTGIAYMDQGIGMAPPDQQASLTESKRAIVAGKR